MPLLDGVVDLVLGGRDQHALEDPPVGNPDVAVAQIGARSVEREQDCVGAEHGHELHPVAEEEDERGDRAGLHERGAQREQHSLDGVRPIDRERRQRLGCVVDAVEAPEDRPGVEPAVQQVLRGVVEQEEDDRETGRDRPAGRLEEHDGTSVEPDMQGLEQEGRHGELRDQARRHPHHDRLVHDGDPVVRPRRSRPPDPGAEQPRQRAPERAARGDPLKRERQREGTGQVAQEDPLLRVQKLVGEAVDEIDDETVHGRPVPGGRRRVSRSRPRPCRRGCRTAPSSPGLRRCCAP